MSSPLGSDPAACRTVLPEQDGPKEQREEFHFVATGFSRFDLDRVVESATRIRLWNFGSPGETDRHIMELRTEDGTTLAVLTLYPGRFEENPQPPSLGVSCLLERFRSFDSIDF